MSLNEMLTEALQEAKKCYREANVCGIQLVIELKNNETVVLYQDSMGSSNTATPRSSPHSKDTYAGQRGILGLKIQYSESVGRLAQLLIDAYGDGLQKQGDVLLNFCLVRESSPYSKKING